MRQKFGCAPSAACADDGFDRRITESVVKVFHAEGDISCVIEGTGCECGWEQHRLITKRCETLHAKTDQWFFWCAGRRHDGNACAGLQSCRTNHASIPCRLTSPLQTICAGPVSINCSPSFHTTRCAPPSDDASSVRLHPRRTMLAADDAEVPVPDDCVGPTPRSK